MNISIVANHFKLTDSLRNHVHKKLKKILDSLEVDSEIHVILSIPKKHIHSAEMALKIKKKYLKVNFESQDMYQSINHSIQKLEQSLKKSKEKQQKISDLSIRNQKNIFEKKILEEKKEEEDLLKKKSLLLKKVSPELLTVSQAIKKLMQAQDNFVLFRRSDLKTINIIRKENKEVLEIIEINNL